MVELLRKLKSDVTKVNVLNIISKVKLFSNCFSCLLKWNMAHDALAKEATKAVINLQKLESLCNGIPCFTCISWFHKVVLPKSCYGAEIWGYGRTECIERVQLKLLKRTPGVNNTTSSLAVLAECGRYPLRVNYFTKCIKVWLKVVSMNYNRLVKQCYLMDYNLHEMGRITWCTKTENLIIR